MINDTFIPVQFILWLCNEKFVTVNRLIQKYLWVINVLGEPGSIYLTCRYKYKITFPFHYWVPLKWKHFPSQRDSKSVNVNLSLKFVDNNPFPGPLITTQEVQFILTADRGSIFCLMNNWLNYINVALIWISEEFFWNTQHFIRSNKFQMGENTAKSTTWFSSNTFKVTVGKISHNNFRKIISIVKEIWAVESWKEWTVRFCLGLALRRVSFCQGYGVIIFSDLSDESVRAIMHALSHPNG